MELINTDDYYETIEHYRLSYKNICIDNKFSKKGLHDLATSLNINDSRQANDETLCKLIGEKVLELTLFSFYSE
jgi:hypothetical protein